MGGIDTLRAAVSASQAFHSRVVRYLANEIGVRQFVDTGPTLPIGTPISQVIQGTAAGCRVVCVIDDDVVMAHAHRFRETTRQVVTDYVRGSLRDLDKLLPKVAEHLDFNSPIAVIGVGAFVLAQDDDTVYKAVARLRDEMSPGSYLALTNVAIDLLGVGIKGPIRRYQQLVEDGKMLRLALRTRHQVGRFFDGMELVEPGVVPVDRWRPGETSPPPDRSRTISYGAVARKP